MGVLQKIKKQNLAFLLTLVSFGFSEPLAFPEALGFGATVTGGREGSVYHVTNLNDSGTGSFRDAVSAPNRIVIFDVGGIINIQSAVSIKSNITILGQTAPGEGIAIHGGKLSTGKQSNIIIRYLRIRPGDKTASNKDDGLNLYNSKNVIIDHCSVEFAPWNNFGGSSTSADYRITGVTVQNTLIANPIYQQFGAHIESVDGTWAWYYNAFINSHNRNPLDKINSIFVNNIHYNYEAGYTTHTSTNFKHDIINNYFVYGPKGKNTWFQVDKNQTIHAKGNMVDNNRDGKLNGGNTNIYYYQGAGTEIDEPWSELTKNGPILSAASAWRYVNSQSGVLPYDDIDSLIWYQASTLGKAGGKDASGTLYTAVNQTGLPNDGWGYVEAGKAMPDTDKDGIPDYFEEAMGYNVSKDDAMEKAPDGYTYIEKYANWLGAMHTEVLQNGSTTFDLRTITKGFKDVSPTYTVSAVSGGKVRLAKDGYSAVFVPDANFKGLAAFQYTVKGNDDTEYTGRVEVLVKKSNLTTGPSISYVSGNESQNIVLGNAIENVVYKYNSCGGAKVSGLPSGVAFQLNTKDSTITISGKPTTAGVFDYTVSTTEDGGKSNSVSGKITVNKNASYVEAPETFGSLVNAAYPTDGLGVYEDKNRDWIDSGYFNFTNSKESYGVWELYSAKTHKTASLNLRYASGSADKINRYMELFINDESYGIVEFPPTENWITWDSVTVQIALVQGLNKLKLVAVDENSGPNLDEFQFDAEGVSMNESEIVYEKEETGIHASTVPFKNPAFAHFDFENGILESTRSGIATIAVYHLNGRLVAKTSKRVQAGVTYFNLKRSDLPKTIYKVRLLFK